MGLKPAHIALQLAQSTRRTSSCSHSNSSSSSKTRMQQQTATRMWPPSLKVRFGAGVPHDGKGEESWERGLVVDAGCWGGSPKMASYRDQEAQGPSNSRELYLLAACRYVLLLLRHLLLWQPRQKPVVGSWKDRRFCKKLKNFRKQETPVLEYHLLELILYADKPLIKEPLPYVCLIRPRIRRSWPRAAAKAACFVAQRG